MADPTADTWQPAPGAQPVSIADADAGEQQGQEHGTLHDFGNQAWASTLEMGEGVLGAVSYATRALGASPDTVQYIEQQKRRVADHVEATLDDMSPKAKLAYHASIFGDGTDAPSPGEVGWGRYIGASLASMVPQIALAVLPGGIVGRAVTKVAGEAAGVASRVAATGGAFGTLQAGDAYNALVKEIDDAPMSEILQSHVGQELQKQGLSDFDIKKQMVSKIAAPLVAAQFALGGVTGAGVGGMVTHGALGTAGRGLAARAGIGAAEGAATMGAQAGGGEALQQNTNVQAGLQSELDTGKLAKAAASGAMGGALLGGGFSALHGGHATPEGVPEETQEAGPTTSQVTPEIKQALQTSLDLGQAPPGVNPGTQQGELFRTTDQANQAQPPAPPTPAAQAPAAGPAAPRPSDGMKVGELRDALKTMPGQDPRLTARMTKSDLATAFDRAQSSTTVGPQGAESAPQPAAPAVAPRAVEGTAPEAPVAEQPELNLAPDMQQAAQNAETPAAAPVAQQPAQTPPTVVDQAAAKAEAPTPAQAEAGNYQKGHVNIGGLDISIETPKDGVRKGVGPDGQPWENTAPDHYGYIKRTNGADGDQVDVTLGPNAHEADKHPVYVFDQKDPKTGKFDEHKAFLGYDAPHKAIEAYDKSFSDGSGPSRRGALNQLDFNEFKDWAQSGDTKGALSYKPDAGTMLKAQAAAKRAAQKAKLATPTGERVKGQVVTGEIEKPGIAEDLEKPNVEEARTNATQNLRDATAKVKVVPLKKGADVSPIISRVMRDLSERIGATDASDNAIHEVISNYAQEKGEQVIPQTKTQYAHVADQVLQMMTKRRLNSDRADVHDTIREDMAKQDKRTGAKTEGAAEDAEAKTLVAEGEDRSEIDQAPKAEEATTVGPTTQEFGTGGKARQEPIKISDKLPYWLDRVMQGEMTPAEAHEKYGEGKAKKRTFGTFRDYVERRLSDAEKDMTVEKMTERSDAKGQAKSEETKREFRSMKDLDKLRDVLDQLPARTPDEFNEHLKKRMDAATAKYQAERDKARQPIEDRIHAKLKDFWGDKQSEAYLRTEARKQAEDEMHGKAVENMMKAGGPKPFGQAVHGDAGMDEYNRYFAEREAKLIKHPYAEIMRDDNLNAAVRNVLKQPGVKVHDVLDTIANDKTVREMAPALSSLARALRKVASNNNVRAGGIRPRNGEKFAGSFWRGEERGRGLVELDPRHDTPTETFLHEVWHSVTSHYLDTLRPGDRDYQLLHAIGTELRDAMEDREADLGYFAVNDIQYALTNPHELHTALMTNPYVQQLAAKVVPSTSLKLKLQGLGYPLQTSKSLWFAFTAFVRRAVGLHGPATDREATLLDHILRPAQDIADRAVTYNAEGGDRTLRDTVGWSMPLGKRAGFADDVMKKADVEGMTDKSRRAGLQVMTTDGIVSVYKAPFETADGNLLERYRDINESVSARSAEFRNKHSDRVSDINDKINSLKNGEAQKLGQLVNDATIAEAKLGKGGVDNSHLEDPSVAAKLQARYDALSPKARDAYDALKDYYAKSRPEERKAELNGLIEAFSLNKDLTDQQKKDFIAAAKDRPTLEKFLDGINKDASWKDVLTAVRGVGDVYKQGFVRGDYFKLGREGDYVVRYGHGKDGDYGVETFEKRGDAEARRAELAKQMGSDRVSQVMDKKVSKLRDIMPSTTVVDELMSAMRSRGMGDREMQSARDLLGSILLQHASNNERVRNSMRRRGVAGASTDVARVLVKHFLGTASRIGYLEHGPARFKALNDLRDHSDTLDGRGEQITASAVIHELEQRLPTGDDATGALTGFARKMTQMGFVQSLMSPGMMLKHTLEAHMNSMALLGARHTLRAPLALARAMKDIAPGMVGQGIGKTGQAAGALVGIGKALKSSDWNLSHYVREKLIKQGANKDHMTALDNALSNASLIDHSNYREMRRIANPGMDATKGVFGKFMDLNGAATHAVDAMNKWVIAKAAFDLEMGKNGGDSKAAVKYAVDTVRQAMPNYNLANKPRIATNQGVLGGFGAPLMQFKMYGFHMYSMMGSLVNASMHGATKAERNEARLAFAGVLATHAMLAGAFTLIADPLRWAGGAYDFFTSPDGKTHDYENDARLWAKRTFGPEIGELFSRGLPHALGLDMHRNIGLANLLEAPDIKSFDKKGILEAIGTVMTGASGEDAATMVGGLEKMIQGDITGGLKDLVPRVVRDVMKAGSLASQGVTDTKGKTILPPDKLSTGDIVTQAMGIQPSRVSEFREGRFAVQEAYEESTSLRAHLMQRWLGDPDNRVATMQKIREFNEDHPGQRVTTAQLLQAAKRARTDEIKSQRTFGLKLPKKAANSLSEAGSFANLR